MCLNPQYLTKQKIYVACGKCVECKIKKATEWAYRITYEARQYEDNCFLTLTYNNENLPKNNELVKRDVQLFLKRLRKKFSEKKIRFFMCGEYGDKRGRPHYHLVLFNFKPSDLYYWTTDNKKNKLYRSPSIEKLWDKGFISIGDVNYDTAKYCAIYLQKESDYKNKKQKPYVLMSRNPGVGFCAISPKILQSDKMYLDGHYLRTPKYFLDKLKEQGCDGLVELVKDKRLRVAKKELLKEPEEIMQNLERRRKKFEKNLNKTLTKGKL